MWSERLKSAVNLSFIIYNVKCTSSVTKFQSKPGQYRVYVVTKFVLCVFILTWTELLSLISKPLIVVNGIGRVREVIGPRPAWYKIRWIKLRVLNERVKNEGRPRVTKPADIHRNYMYYHSIFIFDQKVDRLGNACEALSQLGWLLRGFGCLLL